MYYMYLKFHINVVHAYTCLKIHCLGTMVISLQVTIQTQNGSTSMPKVVPSSNNNINDMHTFNRSCLWKSEAVVVLFHRINCCLPPDACSFAKKLLDVFFSEE